MSRTTALMIGLILLSLGTANGEELVSCARPDHHAAISACSELLVKSGQSAKQMAFTFVERGEAHANLEDCPRAITDFTSAIALWPGYAYAYQVRGECHLRLGDFGQSIADYSNALAINPNMRYARFFRAIGWRARNDAFQALADVAGEISNALQSLGTSADDIQYRAFGHFLRHDYRQAIEVLNGAVDADPKYDRSYVYRGHAYLIVGELQQAIADFSKAIELDPEASDGYVARGDAYGQAGDRDAMRRDLEKAIALLANPKHGDEFGWRAWCRHLLGDHEGALRDVEAALRRLPNEPDFLHVRGRIYDSLGRRADAKADFMTALRFDPGHPETLAALKRLESTAPEK